MIDPRTIVRKILADHLTKARAQYDADLHLIGENARAVSQSHWKFLTALAAEIETMWSHDWIQGPPPQDGNRYTVLAPPHSGELTVHWHQNPPYQGTWHCDDRREMLTIPIRPTYWRRP